MESILDNFGSYFVNYQGTYLEHKKKYFIRRDRAFAIIFDTNNKQFKIL